jgi:hypothetical protein
MTAMVLRLAGQLAEHLVDTEQLRDTHVELERLVHTLPAGPYQRDRGPSQWLLRMLATQTERTQLVPLIDALHRSMREQKAMDFGMQMASAARLASGFPQVGEQLRSRYRVVLLDEYQDTGHAQRVALSALFGGGVDDGLALTAVGDPIQSIYGWRGASATNLPRFAYFGDGKAVPLKKIFYALRPAAALRWLRLHQGDAIAPMHFPTLISACDVPGEVSELVEEILARKAVTRELGSAPLPPPIAAFIDTEFETARRALLGSPSSTNVDHEEVDQFLFKAIERFARG